MTFYQEKQLSRGKNIFAVGIQNLEGQRKYHMQLCSSVSVLKLQKQKKRYTPSSPPFPLKMFSRILFVVLVMQE